VTSAYLDYSGRDDRLSGGVKLIPIETAKGTFRVWTKRIGNNPSIKVLLLHGGPGATHEYFEAFDSYFPAAGLEYYYYDQLGSLYSDQPDAPELWEVPRFVEEVEQVRQALDLGPNNFYLFGQSWGGILALEYALRYQHHLAGLIISNMMASIPAYNQYAQAVLMPAMDQAVLSEIKRMEADGQYDNPRYMELLIPHHYVHHVLRMPFDQWPDPVNRAFKHINPAIYVQCRGRASLAPAVSFSTGTARPTCRTSRCRRWLSALGTTRWTPTTWRGWQTHFRTGNSCSVRGVAISRCTTTSRSISMDWSNFSRTSPTGVTNPMHRPDLT
jgi:proline iminopeptidase